MTRGKAEDAGGLTPAKDDNAAPYHFDRRTLPIFKCVDYTVQHPSIPVCSAYSCASLYTVGQFLPTAHLSSRWDTTLALFFPCILFYHCFILL